MIEGWLRDVPVIALTSIWSLTQIFNEALGVPGVLGDLGKVGVVGPVQLL